MLWMKLSAIVRSNCLDEMMTGTQNRVGLVVYGNSFLGVGWWWFPPAVLMWVQVKIENSFRFLSACAYAEKVIYSFIEVSFFLCRYNTLPSRRTLKNSRLVSKKDDVHVCIMCLRAIMNYQVCLCSESLKIQIRQNQILSSLVSQYCFYLK